ncbi:MAG TPA: hypothetical protein VHW23_30715 [Kofleriaceae bacterium]|jgi:hypothetical protein|nr:hypothetical protein [Kofleriaceae bacterium]
MVKRALAVALVAAGCGKFQDPNVVVDLRTLAIRAEPAEQVIDVDLSQPVTPAALLAQLVPTQVCALVADPAASRRLLWSMTMCALLSDDRCDDDGPQIPLGMGLMDDPEATVPEPAMCVTIMPDANLLSVLAFELQDDTLHGLGGVDYGVVLRVGGENGNRDLDQYAAKTLVVSPRIPAARAANHNPSLDAIDASLEDGTPVPLPLGRCADNPAPYVLASQTKLRLRPIETAGAREVYTVPTLDGRAETFTESLTYQWIASAGGFSRGSTGGPHDLSGNPPPLFSDFKSPAASDLDDQGDRESEGSHNVALWIIQRDERLGVQWYESCIHVAP